MQHGTLLPSVHGFRLCRSPVASCIHLSHRNSPRLGRTPLRVSAKTDVAEAVPLEHLSFSGDDKGTLQLALKVADPRSAAGLVHRYVTLAQQNGRAGTASTLTRSEVTGGGRKPYAQKGTGNARQGSIRTPLRPGGGVIFGPKPRDWSIKMNKKERRLAYATAFQNAAESITVVDDFEGSLQQPRTKDLVAALQRWGVGEKQHALVIVDRMTTNLHLASRNLSHVVTNTISNLSIYDLLRADRIIVEASALAFVKEFYGANVSAADAVSADSAPAEPAAESEGEAEAAPESEA